MQTTNNRDTDTIALRPKKVFLPLCHNGSGDIKALFASCLLPAFAGREYELAAIGDSHAGRGCNKMANIFLKTDCTHMLVIDCDIYFSRTHIDRILSHDVPLVYGLYPKKQADTPACICPFIEGHVRQVTQDLTEVRRAGRGFLLVAREVLEAMKEDNGGHAKRYHNHGQVEWEFFESGVVTGSKSCYDGERDEDGYPKREWISEDWFFCERAREIGVPTLVDTRINLGHEGSFLYEFPMSQLSKMAPESWKDIDGWFDFQEVYNRIVASMNRRQPEPDHFKFVEVGAWMGKSISFMASITFPKVKLFAVDTFKGSPEEDIHAQTIEMHGGDLRKVYDANLSALGITDRITTLQMTSLEASVTFEDGSLDAVFIDAAHTFDSVKEDIEAWLPKVKSGGILAGHDYDDHFPGVKIAVNTVIGEGKFEVIGKSWYYVKP